MMTKRFLTIWFPHLLTDWHAAHQPGLRQQAFVLAAPDHGRMMVKAVNHLAYAKGVTVDMVLADARAFIPELKVLNYEEASRRPLLSKIAGWCIRFTPEAAIDSSDGVILDITGCTHLWDGEQNYINTILQRLTALGYHTKAAVASSIGAAWAASRFRDGATIIQPGAELPAISSLPPAALRLPFGIVERLHKLGLHTIGSFISMPRNSLRRRFGTELLLRIDQALGSTEEFIEAVVPPEPYSERWPVFHPVATQEGIATALTTLLQKLCARLQQDGKGLTEAVFKCYRVDGKLQQVAIHTYRASNNSTHLLKLFELKLSGIEPALGIELFMLDAHNVMDVDPVQETFWKNAGSIHDREIAELLDHVKGKFPNISIQRYLPDEHHWPERSFRAASIQDESTTAWRLDKLRPIVLLHSPERITVTAPIPDYPPMVFRYRGVLHKVIKADGPERIEREWWLDSSGLHRDYYTIEDEWGKRYWLFREGHYHDQQKPTWYIHGFFA